MELKQGSTVQRPAASPYAEAVLSGSQGFGSHVSPAMAYWLWERSDVVGTAVDMIAKSFAQISPSLRDRKTGEFLNFSDDHPVLDLFQNPRSGQSAYQLKYQMMTSYCVTGAVYPVVLGNVRREPAGMYTIGANRAELIEGRDGWLGSIAMSERYDMSTYYRQFLPRRPWTYQRATGDAETILVVESTRRWGLYPQSPLERIYWQVVSKYFSHVSNAAMLKNGARPDMMFSPAEGVLSQTNYDLLKKEVKKYEGPDASHSSVVSAQPLKIEKLSLTPSDMDFANLIMSAKEDVYNGYQVPLPLVMSKTMTLSNYTTAVGALYTMSVLPRAKALYSIISPWLLSRYKGGEKYELTVNEKNLDAIKGLIIERQKAMAAINVYSDNEVRAEGGDKGYGPEGDKIYKPATLVPVGEDDDLRE